LSCDQVGLSIALAELTGNFDMLCVGLLL